MTALTLRFATKDDIKVLRSIDPPYRYIGKRLKDGAVIVIAESDGEIAGYLVYFTLEEGYFLDHVFVKPDFRSNGFGDYLTRLLMTKIMGKVDEFKRIFVEAVVDKRKSPAGLDRIKFLRKMGFMLIGYEGNSAILRFERASVAIARIVDSDRMKPWYPESIHFSFTEEEELNE
jgi:GNAT superfamily N-acetyltransferase